ncbi:MAG TPA: hypothetical protein VHB79_25255 [Polyangiaceae bacterium]|nr:hypothetical protein [Polyangiaceae bacterium]
MKQYFVGLVVIALSCGFKARPALAQSNTAAAVQLFDEGRDALQRGELDIACAKFQESNRLDAAIGTTFNLANCEEQRGRLATAWVLFRQVAGRMKPDDPRLAVANERIATLDRRVPRLTLAVTSSTPAGTRARVDDLELSGASLGSAIPLDPGPHQVVIRSPGQAPRSSSIKLEAGETVTIPLDPAQPSASPREATAHEHPSFLGMSRQQALWVAGGLGAAGLVIGTVAGVVGLNAQAVGNENCSDVTKTCSQSGYDANQRAKSMATVSTIGFVVGVVGIGAATYVFLAVPSSDSPRTAAVGLGGKW